MLETLNGLEFKDWVTITAIIVGPILAVQAQSVVMELSDKKKRRLKIFTTLMSTRAQTLSKAHVEALNMIDIEFYGNKLFGRIKHQSDAEKAVTNAWKNYNNHLNIQSSADGFAVWNVNRFEFLNKLLYEMSKMLGYDFDEVQLKRDCYRPQAHVDLENIQLDVLTGLSKIVKGEPLSMNVVSLPKAQQ